MRPSMVRRAVARVVAAVDRSAGLQSWRALNPQVQWAINDLVVARIRARGGEARSGSLATVKRFMEDGSRDYWQRFWMLPYSRQERAVTVAVREVTRWVKRDGDRW